MKKLKHIVVLLFYFSFLSCKNKIEYEIKLKNENVKEFLYTVIVETNNRKINSNIPGVYMLSSYKFCNYTHSRVYFVKYLNHPISLEVYNITGYTFLNEELIFIHDKSNFNYTTVMPKEEVLKLSNSYIYDGDEPPETRLGYYYIYNDKYSPLNYFNVMDSLVHYDDIEKLNKSIGKYVNIYCL